MDADFQRIALDVFNDVIVNYKFGVRLTPSWLVEMANDKCIVRLVYETGILTAQFVDPREKAERQALKRPGALPPGYPMYSIFSVWKYLYPDDKENYRYDDYDIETQAKAIKRLLEERLSSVLGGDFSWLPGYKQSQIR